MKNPKLKKELDNQCINYIQKFPEDIKERGMWLFEIINKRIDYHHIRERYNELKKFISEVDLFNYDDNYIVQITNEYKYIAWYYYRELFKRKILSDEYEFFLSNPSYRLIRQLAENKLIAKNVLVVNIANNLNKYILNTTSRNIHRMIKEFAEFKQAEYGSNFFQSVSEFMAKYKINSFNDFNDDIFEKYFTEIKPNGKYATIGVKSFAVYVVQHMDAHNKPILYTEYVLFNSKFQNKFEMGFRPIIYNNIDPVPKNDKWLLIANHDNLTTKRLNVSSTIAFNFAEITNKQLRNHLKNYYWYDTNSSLVSKYTKFHRLVKFLNMYFTDANKIYTEISPSICASFKSYVFSKTQNRRTRMSTLSNIKVFFEYLKENTDIDISSSCFFFLSSLGEVRNENIKGVPKEHLKLLADYYDKHKYDSQKDLNYYAIFHLAINTEFRISQILGLTTDCLKENLKNNEYYIESIMKQSGGNVVKQPCSKIVASIIRGIINATKNDRENLPLNIKNHLFYKKSVLYNTMINITQTEFTRQLENVCKKLNIPRYNTKNLRTTYITNAKEYIIKNGLSDMNLLSITNHANIDTIHNHYLEEKKKDALQAVIGVVIGDVNIDGTVDIKKDEYNTSKEVMVANGCGFCQASKCEIPGLLPCQKCKYFYSTLDNIPYYLNEIERLKQINTGANNPHDAEDIINLIRLNGHILTKLLELKGE